MVLEVWRKNATKYISIEIVKLLYMAIRLCNLLENLLYSRWKTLHYESLSIQFIIAHSQAFSCFFTTFLQYFSILFSTSRF